MYLYLGTVFRVPVLLPDSREQEVPVPGGKVPEKIKYNSGTCQVHL